MCLVFELKLLVIWLRWIQVAYGLTDPNCVNGRYKTLGTTEGKPSVALQKNSNDTYVDNDVTFTCKIRANPAADIFWLYEGRFLTNEDQKAAYFYSPCNTTLKIRFAEPRDTGRYSCMARNSYGETLSTPVTLGVQQQVVYLGNYESASIEKLTSCDAGSKTITLMCKHNTSRGICVWKKQNDSLNEEKTSYCDDMMCCLSIRDFSDNDVGLYTCFMYADVRKAEVMIPKQDGKSKRCNTGTSSSATKTHFGVWCFGIIALIMNVF